MRVSNFEFGGCVSCSREWSLRLSDPSLRAITLSECGWRKSNIQEKKGKIPACLTVIRTLSRGLEKEPLFLEILLGGTGVRECVGLVILGDEVGDNGAGFPKDDARVRVFDG